MRKVIIQNLTITILSKIFSFVSFIYIVKILSEADYGAFVYITMILSLLPMLQLGSMHGTMILLPKYITDSTKNEETLFWYSNYFSHLIQIFAVIVLFFIDITISEYIVIIIGLNFILSHYMSNAMMYLNAQHKFEKVNIIKSIDQLAKPISVLIIFHFYHNIESIFIAQLLVTTITCFVAVILVPLKFIKFNSILLTDTIKSIYKLGFFIYLTWAIDILFRTADRWFISQFYTIKELAEYGFTSSLAMNVWLVAMSFFAPYAQLLYKNVAQNKFRNVKNIVISTNKKIYILVSIISIVAIVLYPSVLDLIVHKYFGTELLFSILVISAILLSINNMYIYYMLSNNFHFILLKYQSIILVLNLLLNAIFAFYHLDIVYYSYSTIVTLGLYFWLLRRYFFIDITKKLGENQI